VNSSNPKLWIGVSIFIVALLVLIFTAFAVVVIQSSIKTEPKGLLKFNELAPPDTYPEELNFTYFTCIGYA
jgi:hypothetical protein